MSKKTKCLRLTRRYLDRISKDAFTAFSMGYADAEQGKEQHDPPQTATADGLTNAALSLAHELYKRGYNAGRGDENESA